MPKQLIQLLLISNELAAHTLVAPSPDPLETDSIELLASSLTLTSFSWSDSFNDDDCKNPKPQSQTKYAGCAADNKPNSNSYLHVNVGTVHANRDFNVKLSMSDD